MATKSQPIGTPVDPRSPETKHYAIEPAGPLGDNPATAGPGPTSVRSNTPENADGHLRPSPEDTNTTPDSTPEK